MSVATGSLDEGDEQQEPKKSPLEDPSFLHSYFVRRSEAPKYLSSGVISFVFDQAVKEVAKADPNNIQEVAASQLAIINSYYQSGLQQSQQSFRWSLIWGGVGFGFLIVAISVLLFRQPTEVAVASGIAGALVEVFAGTYLYLYKHASDQLAAFRASLESTQRMLLANSMCEQLTGDVEQTTRAELIRLMANSAVQLTGVKQEVSHSYAALATPHRIP